MKIPKLYKWLGYVCLFLGPIATAILKNDSIIQGSFLVVVVTLLILFGNHCIKKSEVITRELTMKSMLDEESLAGLIKLNGLMFTREELKTTFKIEISIQTIRYLIQQDIIRTEVFPLSEDGSNITYGYYLTVFGRDVLRRHIGIVHLFPDKIIDIYKTAYWLGHKRVFSIEKQAFKKIYKKDFDDCLSSFFGCIPQEYGGFKNNISYENKIDIVRKFLENQRLSFEDKMKIITDGKV